MRKIWLVVKREYLTRVRTKGFILSTVGLPLLSVGIFAISIALATRKTEVTFRIAILDNLGGLAPQIMQGLNEKLPDGQPAYRLMTNRPSTRATATTRGELNQQVRNEQLDGYLEVPNDILSGKDATFYTRNPDDFQTSHDVNRALNDALIARRLSDRGVHIDNMPEILRGVDLSMVKVTKTGESKEGFESMIVQVSIVMILYITLVVYGMMTMRSVVEEKSTRIVEMLASSIKPSYLLTGKILGVAAVGFTQYLIWMVTGALVSTYGAAMGSVFRPGAVAPFFHLPLTYLIYPPIFFVAGYFLYASLYAALGAMVSSEEEMQQVQMPLTILLVGCFILYPIIQHAPNSAMSVALSLFPFSSPILMVLRITVQTPPFWQIALSLALCVATTVGVIQVSAKIYRVGILMYGKRPSLVELLRWLRYT